MKNMFFHHLRSTKKIKYDFRFRNKHLDLLTKNDYIKKRILLCPENFYNFALNVIASAVTSKENKSKTVLRRI